MRRHLRRSLEQAVGRHRRTLLLFGVGLTLTALIAVGFARLASELVVIVARAATSNDPARVGRGLPSPGRAAVSVPPPARRGDARAAVSPPEAGSAAELLWKRDLLVPVEGVSAGKLVQSFDEPRGKRRHEAIDILAPHGTPVIAVEDGTIAKLFWSDFGGHTIYQFDPSGQYAYYYAHLQRYAYGLQEGRTVTKGQVIGYVGASGNASPEAPHLHFAIFKLGPERKWWEGTPIDPFPIFR